MPWWVKRGDSLQILALDFGNGFDPPDGEFSWRINLNNGAQIIESGDPQGWGMTLTTGVASGNPLDPFWDLLTVTAPGDVGTYKPGSISAAAGVIFIEYYGEERSPGVYDYWVATCGTQEEMVARFALWDATINNWRWSTANVVTIYLPRPTGPDDNPQLVYPGIWQLPSLYGNPVATWQAEINGNPTASHGFHLAANDGFTPYNSGEADNDAVGWVYWQEDQGFGSQLNNFYWEGDEQDYKLSCSIVSSVGGTFKDGFNILSNSVGFNIHCRPSCPLGAYEATFVIDPNVDPEVNPVAFPTIVLPGMHGWIDYETVHELTLRVVVFDPEEEYPPDQYDPDPVPSTCDYDRVDGPVCGESDRVDGCQSAAARVEGAVAASYGRVSD